MHAIVRRIEGIFTMAPFDCNEQNSLCVCFVIQFSFIICVVTGFKKIPRHFLNQSDLKSEATMNYFHVFFRACIRYTSRYDWFV